MTQDEVEALARKIHRTPDFDGKVNLMRSAPRQFQRAVELAVGRLELADGRGGAKVGYNLSEVGDRSHGVLACPKCGGTQFKAKRSLGKKLVTGALALPTAGAALAVGALGKKTRVKCETCSTEYLRG